MVAAAAYSLSLASSASLYGAARAHDGKKARRQTSESMHKNTLDIPYIAVYNLSCANAVPWIALTHETCSLFKYLLRKKRIFFLTSRHPLRGRSRAVSSARAPRTAPYFSLLGAPRASVVCLSHVSMTTTAVNASSAEMYRDERRLAEAWLLK